MKNLLFKIRRWWRVRQIRREMRRIDDERMQEVIYMTLATGKPVVGTTDDEGNFSIEIID